MWTSTNAPRPCSSAAKWNNRSPEGAAREVQMVKFCCPWLWAARQGADMLAKTTGGPPLPPRHFTRKDLFMAHPGISLDHQVLHDGFVVEIHEKIEQLLQDAAAIEQLRLLWQQAPVMVFRRQSIEEHEQVQFSQQFGACEVLRRKVGRASWRERGCQYV